MNIPFSGFWLKVFLSLTLSIVVIASLVGVDLLESMCFSRATLLELELGKLLSGIGFLGCLMGVGGDF
jgi:hypothetical protein